jgi:DNA-binding NarL/FixJ family response regulator
MPIKVAIVEDDERVCESLAVLIDGTAEMRCTGTYPTAEKALQEIPLHPPDVVLMDINLPRMSGIECVQKLKTAVPRVQILMLTMFEDSEQIFKSLTAGASGYLLKRTPPSKLLESINEVYRGASPMSGKIARIVVQYFQTLKSTPDPDCEKLSAREDEILGLLSKGYRYKEIGSLLGISFDTVRSHMRNIYDKLHVHSRTEAVVKYLKH